MERNLAFFFRRDFRDDPVAVLNEVLGQQDSLSCLIVDYLEFSHCEPASPEKVSKTAARSKAKRVIRFLGKEASDRGIPVFVFCQRKADDLGAVRKSIGADQIEKFPQIVKLCDVFVGISHLAARPSELHVRQFANGQYMLVDAYGTTVRIPVAADFGFQRFVPRKEREPADDPVLKAQARERDLMSERHGFVKISRRALRSVAELQHPPTFNVFVFCHLIAKHAPGPDVGTFFWGAEKIAAALGLSPKVTRAALGRLLAQQLISKRGKVRRAIRYKVRGVGDKIPEDGGFFILANNLSDSARTSFLSDPVLFRVWTALIAMARFSPDPEGIFERGQIPGDASLVAQRIAEFTGDCGEEVMKAINQLMDQGRIVPFLSPFYEMPGLMIPNYRLYQCGALYRKQGNVRETKRYVQANEREDCGNLEGN
ncbi:hypothetical protein [Luteolibacter luteus]|uniref:Uncharacterized protein n=1 Tax=Luteolibacter luteus TaxID=2728835 RepID=A0A858RDW3_9BACT|nr:hypothetical protein [Luteolibacter luteus]QJE95276.1 hypothetical protein HHL09_05620 [Luteolibacter luteus]